MSVNGPFADNIDRLLGLHRLTGRDASKLLDVSTVAVSEWRQGKRMPGLPALLKLSAMFEVPGDRLVTATFPELLAQELRDVDRFERVEAKVARALRGLRAVGGRPHVADIPWLVTPEEVPENLPSRRAGKPATKTGTYRQTPSSKRKSTR